MTGPNPDKLLDEDAIIFSYHARVRMFEKGVSTEDVISLLREGDVIEEYADDEPCPSFLLYGILNTIPYHLVVAGAPIISG